MSSGPTAFRGLRFLRSFIMPFTLILANVISGCVLLSKMMIVVQILFAIDSAEMCLEGVCLCLGLAVC